MPGLQNQDIRVEQLTMLPNRPALFTGSGGVPPPQKEARGRDAPAPSFRLSPPQRERNHRAERVSAGHSLEGQTSSQGDRRAVFAFLFPFLAWLTVLQATGEAAEPSARVVRIMPVGDSITEGGSAFVNYRYPLLKKLTDAGYRVEYVGSRESDSPAGKLRHEGYGGKNAEFLATAAVKSFRQFPADIVLLHCGHNHFVDEKPVPGIVAAVETMIAAFRTANPRVVVLLAQVIPGGKLPKYAYIPALNQALGELPRRLHTPAQPVIIVNQAEGFDWRTDTIADKVHPNAQGAEKMAARWFAALTGVLPKAP